MAQNYVDNFFNHVGLHDNLDFYLGNKINRVFGAAVDLRMPFLPPKALDLTYCHALDAKG